MRKILAILFALTILLSLPITVSADDSLSIYFFGPEGSLKTAMDLDQTIHFVNDPSSADVIVLAGTITDPAGIHNMVSSGKGLILISNSSFTSPEISILLGENIKIQKRSNPLSLSPDKDLSDPILNEIIWTSAPQIRERIMVTGGSIDPLGGWL